MKAAILATCLAITASFTMATTTMAEKAATTPTTINETAAKKCRYGSYVDSSGKRHCRRRPSGSHSG